MELATPITVYWDLPGNDWESGSLRRTCAEIVACCPLMLQLGLPAVPSWPALRDALAPLAGAPIGVTLTLPAASFPVWPEDGEGHGVRLRELLFACNTLEECRELADRVKQGSHPPVAGATIGVSFPVTHRNWRQLPGVAECCREAGIRRLVLPMQRLYRGETPFFLTRSERDELAAALQGAGGTGNPDITIHDPFLWPAFHPGRPFPPTVCQAANTMIAIAPDGAVYPCPTLPLRLGSVAETPLRDILASAEKKSLRHRLLEPPAGCGDCRDAAVCRGGCRGRGLALHGSLDGVDDACH